MYIDGQFYLQLIDILKVIGINFVTNDRNWMYKRGIVALFCII